MRYQISLFLSVKVLSLSAFIPKSSTFNGRSFRDMTSEKNIQVLPVTEAVEGILKIDTKKGQEVHLWYNTWGNPEGIPVLFVHGGPGQCVADYENINGDFFKKENYFVVEVDQRGTGKSTPSVRDITPGKNDESNVGVQNMDIYSDITIGQMSADFENIRNHLKIKKWLVFGGSWGSTLALDYAERFPESCVGLILRGIFLCTRQEMDDVYTLRAITRLAEKTGNERFIKDFKHFFDHVEAYHKRYYPNADGLEPNNAEGILRLYEKLICEGDRLAVWKFYVYENNLMEEDPSKYLDYNVINESTYAEAQSVAFFEARLFLNGVYEQKAYNLLDRTTSLSGKVPTWVVQGTGDLVCPERFAEMLVSKLRAAGVLQKAHFVDAGHKASSTGIKNKLIEVVNDFYSKYTSDELKEFKEFKDH